jgi:hypothetical protein
MATATFALGIGCPRRISGSSEGCNYATTVWCRETNSWPPMWECVSMERPEPRLTWMIHLLYYSDQLFSRASHRKNQIYIYIRLKSKEIFSTISAREKLQIDAGFLQWWPRPGNTVPTLHHVHYITRPAGWLWKWTLKIRDGVDCDDLIN